MEIKIQQTLQTYTEMNFILVYQWKITVKFSERVRHIKIQINR